MIRFDRLKELKEERHVSFRKIDSDCGFASSNTCRWNKINPSAEFVKKVADYFNVSVAYLMGESDFRTESDAVVAKWTADQNPGLADEVRRISAGIRIPVYGEVPCGIPNDAIEMLDADEWEEIPVESSKTGIYFGLTAKGDSMSPRIEAGDVMIVRYQPDAETGDIVIAKIGNDSCCKKLIKKDSGIVLQSYNPSYEPMYFTNEEIVSHDVHIIGVVVENRQKYKRY